MTKATKLHMSSADANELPEVEVMDMETNTAVNVDDAH